MNSGDRDNDCRAIFAGQSTAAAWSAAKVGHRLAQDVQTHMHTLASMNTNNGRCSAKGTLADSGFGATSYLGAYERDMPLWC